MTEPLLLTPEQAAQRLSIGRTQLYGMLARGEIRSITLGKTRRISPLDLEEFVERKRREVGATSNGLAKGAYTSPK